MEIIYSYTRKQAIEDGFQVAVPVENSKEAGFKFPVFMTRKVWDKYVEVPEGMEATQQLSARLWDVLFMLYIEIKRKVTDCQTLNFKLTVQLPNKGDWWKNEKRISDSPIHREVTLKSIIGAVDVDDPNPCITILLPDED